MRERIYLGRLEELIKNYQFNLPLSIYLRQEFNKRRNMGSRDRKRTREDIFNYFRIGKNYPDMTIPERVAIGSYICNNTRSAELDYIISNHSPFQPEEIPQSLESKLNHIKAELPQFDIEKIFPAVNQISNGINKEKFLNSFLIQPRLWIRVRKNFKNELLTELKEKEIPYENSEYSSLAFSFKNGSPVHTLDCYLNGAFEIQDLNSQKCAEKILPASTEYWWDACCGSGGKSLAILDQAPGLNLTVSDIRESTLQNLKLRVKKTGQKIARTLILDLNTSSPELPGMFDGIIADVPCSGSGTWARSPELLSSFSEQSLFDKFIPLQRNIVRNLTNALKPQKCLYYITCSVFKVENEENIAYFEKNLGLKCKSSEYLEGSDKGADSMFFAILEKME
ncbi:MAG: RsmB/NOP family class I SAM-dependent RNA methyltransferase [Bacteroidetes bacterium]|nr:MAG: RsmB/NOP family class I SAM-dependent RNA methyltransferase [Bacteroidota bacterium]